MWEGMTLLHTRRSCGETADMITCGGGGGGGDSGGKGDRCLWRRLLDGNWNDQQWTVRTQSFIRTPKRSLNPNPKP